MIRHSMTILHKEVRSHNNQLTTNYIRNSRYNAEQKLDFVSVCTSYPEAAMLKVNNNINPLPPQLIDQCVYFKNEITWPAIVLPFVNPKANANHIF